MVKLPFRSGPLSHKSSKGASAENIACLYLSQQGIKIVERNYRTQRGEIDIIAREDDTLIFVEVRLRSKPNFGDAAQSIDARKQARLITAAQHYLLKKGLTDAQPCRFDAICMSTVDTDTAKTDTHPNRQTIDWIRDAFRPEA